jgi:hypothetical protein
MGRMFVGFVTKDFRRGRRDGREWRPAIDRGRAWRTRGSAEMQAQIAMCGLVSGKRLIVLDPVSDVRGARKQQRHHRKQRYQAVVAKNANAGQWTGDGRGVSRVGADDAHGRSETIGWPVPGQLKDNPAYDELPSDPAVPLKFNSDTLGAHLEQQLLPAYLVSGDEPLLTAEATDAIRARARAAGFTERETSFMERGGDWNDIRASAANLSLFAERRIVEIRMATAKPGNTGSAAIVALLENRDPDRLILINTPKLDRDAQGSEWVRAVETHGALVQVWPVEASKLVGWLRGRAKRLRLTADDDALEILAERTEGNLLAAHQELEPGAGKIAAAGEGRSHYR